jgi:hypothetical protein
MRKSPQFQQPSLWSMTSNVLWGRGVQVRFEVISNTVATAAAVVGIIVVAIM